MLAFNSLLEVRFQVCSRCVPGKRTDPLCFRGNRQASGCSGCFCKRSRSPSALRRGVLHSRVTREAAVLTALTQPLLSCALKAWKLFKGTFLVHFRNAHRLLPTSSGLFALAGFYVSPCCVMSPPYRGVLGD